MDNRDMRLLITAALGIVLGLFCLSVVFGSWYTIDQTQRGVLLRNGAIVEVVQPGLHFKWPFVESIVRVDMQTHTRSWGYDKTINKDTMEAYSADQQPAFLRVSLTFQVAPDKVADIYTRFGGDYEGAVNRLIQPHVFERIKTVFGQYTAARAISARGQLNTDATKAMIDAISYDPTFIINSVQIENISFSGDYIKSVEARMQAEVEVQRLRQNLERERVQADIVVTQAKAQADATRANALAEAERIKLRGDAEAQAITARAKALADNPALVGLVQAEKWDGKLPATMVPGGAVPMLTMR